MIERKLFIIKELKSCHQEDILLAKKLFMILLNKKTKASGLLKSVDPNNLIERG